MAVSGAVFKLVVSRRFSSGCCTHNFETAVHLVRAPHGQSTAFEVGWCFLTNSVPLTLRARHFQAATTAKAEVATRTSAWRTPEAITEVIIRAATVVMR